MQIALARAADFDALRAFAERTFRIAFEKDNAPDQFEQYCAKAFSAAQLEQEISHPHSAFWIGWEETQLAAYLKLNFDRHPAELANARTVQVERLYVEPALQGRRLGAQMLEFAQQEAQKVNAEWLWLTVWDRNLPSIRFYERNGYEIFGTKTFMLGTEAQTDLLMRQGIF